VTVPAPAPAGVDRVLDLLARWGADHYDEDITQLDHALQSAALARAAGSDDALVAAALLHDVGHLLDMEAGRIDGTVPDVDLGHEATGARWLATLFPPEVTGPIALHVRAKRYLCAIDPTYAAGLTPGSAASLIRQGGPMGRAEAAAFAAHPAAEAAVRLRRWDDGGKIDGLEVPGLDHYRSVLESLAVVVPVRTDSASALVTYGGDPPPE